jgi:lipid A 3-O-deacylase
MHRKNAGRWLIGLLGLLMSIAGQTQSPGSVRGTFDDENDGFASRDDQHYTQGLLFSALYPALASDDRWSDAFDTVGTILPPFRAGAETQRHVAWLVLGQSLFTPEDLAIVPPDPHDRPYAAWLYTGINLLQQDRGQWLNSLELLGGVVGPDALGKELQNGTHHLLGWNEAQGWGYQLPNRATGQLSYDIKRRLGCQISGDLAVDAVPEVGVSMGNVFRYVDAGALLRIGNALGVDYGPEHIRPAASGTAWFDADALGAGFPRGYLYTGFQARRVYYNLFIDGSSEVAPPGIMRRSSVVDVLVGGALFLPWAIRIDFAATRRGQEYFGQRCYQSGPPHDCDDIFGSILVSMNL